LRPDGLAGDLVLIGRARDLFTDSRGDARVLGEAGYQARIAFPGQREIAQIETDPARAEVQRLVGTRASTGFRAALDAALPAERDARSPLYLLLDDLPVAALVSGYSLTTVAAPRIAKERPMLLQHPDLCAGWRTGGTILVEIEQEGRVPVVTGPLARSLARDGDPVAWHDFPPLPAHGMRRHRRLDLVRGEPLAVDVLFRDSHMAADGTETVVHEYTVAAEVAAATLEIERIEATARALPWIECNPAAASASRLVGRHVAGLRPSVRAELTGNTTCTHLNDTLRSIEDVEALARVLARESA
jgi:hypothetical protein